MKKYQKKGEGAVDAKSLYLNQTLMSVTMGILLFTRVEEVEGLAIGSGENTRRLLFAGIFYK